MVVYFHVTVIEAAEGKDEREERKNKLEKDFYMQRIRDQSNE